MYKPKKYNTTIIIEGRKNYHNFIKWLMINNIIYTTIIHKKISGKNPLIFLLL